MLDTQTVAPTPLHQLPDSALIESLPLPEDKRELTASERAALDELWRRHYETLRKHLRRIIYSSRSMCPFFWEREQFLDASLSRAYIHFLKRIRRKDYSNFAGYLCTLAYSSAIDEQRSITGRIVAESTRAPEPPTGGEVAPESEGMPSLAEQSPDEESSEGSEATAPWKSNIKVEHGDQVFRLKSKLPDAFYEASAGERRAIVRELLEIHASQSPTNATSTMALKMRFWQDYTWTEIAQRLMSWSWEGLDACARKASRFVEADCEKLRLLLYETFKITGPRQL